MGDFRYQRPQPSQEEIATLTDVIYGESWDDAAAPWGKDGDSGRRRLPNAKWATAVRHINEEVAILEALIHTGHSPSETAKAFDISLSKVKGVVNAGAVNQRWLAALNPRARRDLQATVDAMKSGQRGGIEGSSDGRTASEAVRP